MEVPKPRGYLKEVALLFLKLGATSFGGPAAYIGLMHHETVRRRGWVDNQQFLDLVGATNLIPGPNATEMAIHLGLIRAGWPGLIAAGALFILPGMLTTIAVAWAYVRFGSLPAVEWVLYGVKPVVIAIVVHALWSLARAGARGPAAALLGAAILAGYLFGLNEIALLFAGAAVALALHGGRRLVKHSLSAIIAVPAVLKVALATSASAVPFGQTALFLSFLKIGAVLYGSGYVLLAFLRSEFVARLGWLTEQQVLDAVVAGQITPGPVFSSATFVGYLLGGWPSALLATLGIFLPSFVFVGLLSRILPLVRNSPWASAFLDGVNIASLSLMVGVTVQLGRAAVVDLFTLALAAAALVVLVRSRTNSVWLVLGGGLLGLAFKAVSQPL